MYYLSHQAFETCPLFHDYRLDRRQLTQTHTVATSTRSEVHRVGRVPYHTKSAWAGTNNARNRDIHMAPPKTIDSKKQRHCAHTTLTTWPSLDSHIIEQNEITWPFGQWGDPNAIRVILIAIDHRRWWWAETNGDLIWRCPDDKRRTCDRGNRSSRDRWMRV